MTPTLAEQIAEAVLEECYIKHRGQPLSGKELTALIAARTQPLEADQHRIDEIIRLNLLTAGGTDNEGKSVEIIYGHRDAIDSAIAARAALAATAKGAR